MSKDMTRRSALIPGFLLLAQLLVLAYMQIPEDVKIPPSADAMENPLKGDPKAALTGARIYKKVCWVCHGDNGDGTGPQAAELETKPADFNDPLVVNRTDGALFWWVSNGGNGMQPFKESLMQEQIWQTVVYVRKVQGLN